MLCMLIDILMTDLYMCLLTFDQGSDNIQLRIQCNQYLFQFWYILSSLLGTLLREKKHIIHISLHQLAMEKDIYFIQSNFIRFRNDLLLSLDYWHHNLHLQLVGGISIAESKKCLFGYYSGNCFRYTYI